jgi:ABC-type multidrug transport system fused ATPase/permease subunit
VIVAYRRGSITLADEVVFVQHGRVAARGTHDQLLADVPGYADLVRAYQTREVADREAWSQ